MATATGVASPKRFVRHVALASDVATTTSYGPATGAVKQSAVDAIDAEAAELDKICMALWNNPGLGYTEEE